MVGIVVFRVFWEVGIELRLYWIFCLEFYVFDIRGKYGFIGYWGKGFFFFDCFFEFLFYRSLEGSGFYG